MRNTLGLLAGLLCWLPAIASADPPAQKLPSALLVFPFIESQGDRDTRIEILNLSGTQQTLQCFYIDGFSCNEVGFLLSLTPYQPVSWLASSGFSSGFSAVPPFFGDGELKCAVAPQQPQIEFHNTIQGRATVFGTDGSTVSLGAVGFQRLSDGDFTGTVSLDGSTYAQCPDRLHFQVLTDLPTSTSDMIIVPCSENLVLQQPTTIHLSFTITNEFETSFSAASVVTCFGRTTLGAIASTLTRAVLGSDTAHVVVRGGAGPVLGLVIDNVPGAKTAGNEPSFQGGRSATLSFPSVLNP